VQEFLRNQMDGSVSTEAMLSRRSLGSAVDAGVVIAMTSTL